MFIPLAHVGEFEDVSDFRWRFAGLAFAGLLLIAYWQEWVVSPFQWDLAIALTFVFGYRTFMRAFQAAASRRISADQAVVVAAVAALYVGEYLAAAEVVYIMLVGDTLEAYTADRFRSDLKRLMTCIPPLSHVLRDGAEAMVPVESIAIGESVVVYPGARIPVDGEILEGESLIDESTITGESVPRERTVSESVHAGTLNQSGRLVIRVHQVGGSTVLNRIVQLVEHAKENKAPIQRTADRYARWFLPLVLALSAVCYLLTGDVMRSVAVLIVACPCAMVLATPAAVLASVSSLARRGVVVKGGREVETLAGVDCFAFDKTGTVTSGTPELEAILTFDGAEEDQALAAAASVEAHSEHLLAEAIRHASERRSLRLPEIEGVRRHSGLGMEGTVNEPLFSPEKGRTRVLVGSLRFMEGQEVHIPEAVRQALDRHSTEGAISVLVAYDEEVTGILVFRDQARPEAAEAIHDLSHLGIRKLLLLTGDNEKTARQVARSVGLNEVSANLLPEEKLDRLRQAQQQGFTIAMVGDGINDSPSLAAADVGIAMGDTGTDIAAEAAGVVLLGERALSRIPELIQTSRRTVKIIQDNIFWFGFVINVAAVLAAFAGYLGAIQAAILHQAASFLVLMNSLRLLKDWPSVAHFWDFLGEFRGDRGWQALRSSLLTLRPGPKHRRLAQSFLILLMSGYFFSGLTLVSPEEVALVGRFGRILQTELGPGLHYRLPWPIEKIHRVQPARVNALEIGFRSDSVMTANSEPPAYEWNIQHREGRYRREPEEAQMLTGDEYLLDVNAVVHYAIADPKLYLFQSTDVVQMLRTVAEGVLRRTVARYPLDAVMVSERRTVESSARAEIEQVSKSLGLGLRILSLELQDVHPALEVVDAFREVASAVEEKNRLINEAEGYANQRIPLARGQSQKQMIDAGAYGIKRTRSAEGESERFVARQRAYRDWRRPTAVRLYLETLEEVLADLRKYVLDQTSGQRKIILLKDSVTLEDLQDKLNDLDMGSPGISGQPKQ